MGLRPRERQPKEETLRDRRNRHTEYEPKDERLDKLITDRRVEAQAVLERVITQRRTVPPLMAKLAEDAERRKTWNEAEAIVFAGEKPVQGEQPDLDVEEMIEEVKEAAEAVREMSVVRDLVNDSVSGFHV